MLILLVASLLTLDLSLLTFGVPIVIVVTEGGSEEESGFGSGSKFSWELLVVCLVGGFVLFLVLACCITRGCKRWKSKSSSIKSTPPGTESKPKERKGGSSATPPPNSVTSNLPRVPPQAKPVFSMTGNGSSQSPRPWRPPGTVTIDAQGNILRY
ncbi:hypothetical protein DL96DRAFT_1621915 [Flagelloscypha sp. PMI_526]|nr:hypothetical protein DL96DRAFT_1621915 [Flagelloscypha sp. PMI_526]